MFRIKTAIRFRPDLSGLIILRKPPEGFWPLGLTLLLSNQPLGSSVTLVLMLALVGGLALTRKLPARSMANCAMIGLFYLIVALAYRMVSDVNIGLFFLYSFYLGACAVFFLTMRKIISRLTSAELDESIALLLFMDLAINIPPVLLQVSLHGIGDFVGGMSGLLSFGSLSQGRTNTVRAGLLMALAFARYSRKKDPLSAISASFNMTVLLIALSMTTILSAFGAGMTVLLLGKKQTMKLPKMVAILSVAVVGGIFNKMKYGVSYADYLLALNYHYNFTPKLNIYKHALEDMIPSQPWIVLFGDSLGNFMNRFAILFNFENYSGFPFKDVLEQVFLSPLTKEHVIQRYYLESGVVGNSIISVPWSSTLSFLLEMGLIGVLLALFFLRGFIKDLMKENQGVIGSGFFFLTFFFFNSMFDVYLDYPEVLFPFIMLGLLMGAQGKSSQVSPSSASGS